jgi:hypothetical protein
MKRYLIIFLAAAAILLPLLWGKTADGASSEKKHRRRENRDASSNEKREDKAVDTHTSQTQKSAMVEDNQSSNTAKTAQIEQVEQPKPSDDDGMLLEYNIFDPDRSSNHEIVTTAKPPEADRISLVGALQMDDACVVFFQGNKSEFSGACSVGDKIGDFEVKEIGTERIKLGDANKQTIDLEVGQGLTRTGNGPWEISKETYVAPEALKVSETTPSQPGDGSESKDGQSEEVKSDDKKSESKGSSSSEDAILKKMMERRNQETK